MKPLLLFATASLVSPFAEGRKWTDVVPPSVMDPIDGGAFRYLIDSDPFLNGNIIPQTDAPTVDPARATTGPTQEPSFHPTFAPTEVPTVVPTLHPTTALPTENPNPYPELPEPANPPAHYFNYNTNESARYGPGKLALIKGSDSSFHVGMKNNRWGSVKSPLNNYWKEFTNEGWGPWKGVLDNRNVYRNVCESGKMQSPIDLKPNGAACRESHEVRSLVSSSFTSCCVHPVLSTHSSIIHKPNKQPGDYRVSNRRVKKEIHHNKLRLVYERRPCRDLNDVKCQEPDPPYADFPNGWGGFADVMHIDIKVPSEHRMNSKTYEAEMQIFHLHPGRRRMPTQSVLIEARSDGYNAYFQTAIDAFYFEYQRNRDFCTLRNLRHRRVLSYVDGILGNGTSLQPDDFELSTDLDRPDYNEHAEKMERLLQSRSWDPHHPALIPTIHFYRYDGSLTEPPCGEWVSWFVADKPMVIDFRQLEQLKTIIFLNFDSNCRQTSSHYDQSVARPIRSTGRRPVSQCTPADFGPDK